MLGSSVKPCSQAICSSPSGGACGRAAVVQDDISLAIKTKQLCAVSVDRRVVLPEFLPSYMLFHLVVFPFTDGPNVKPRPALVICQSERHQDVFLAFISSKISGAANSDELDINADHPQFQQNALKLSSRCRLSRMTTLATPFVRVCVHPAGVCGCGGYLSGLAFGPRSPDPLRQQRGSPLPAGSGVPDQGGAAVGGGAVGVGGKMPEMTGPARRHPSRA